MFALPPEALSIVLVTSANILSKQTVWLFAKRLTVAFMYLLYSNVIVFRSAASVDVRVVLEPHCSLWRLPVLLTSVMRLRAKRILRAVLKSASRIQ